MLGLDLGRPGCRSGHRGFHARIDPTGTLTETEIEAGTAVPRSTAERLLCDARAQVVHRRVHEYRWTIDRDAVGGFGWITPDGECYRAGPSAPAFA